MKKILISLSGGLDSATLLGQLKKEDYQVQAISFDYGAKHNQYESKAAQNLADYYNINLQKIDITSLFKNFKSDLLLNGEEIPEGHYQSKNMESTVVPARNMIFLSIMTGLAISKNIDAIAIAIHAGDHFIYPDCRPSFIASIDQTIMWASDEKVYLIAPFTNLTKTQIVSKAIELQVPLQLTRTCYKDQELSCGKCGSCNERLEAFANNGINDLVVYE